MYLHIGENNTIPESSVLGVFNIGTNDNYLMIGYIRGSRTFVYTDKGDVVFSQTNMRSLSDRFENGYERLIENYNLIPTANE